MVRITRRRLLTTTASGVVAGSFAGCIGGSPTETGGREGVTAQASFFVFGDFASHVAGDAATAETLVPVGQHGHGWEPGPKIQADVLDADLFVRGVEGFQPWADDVEANVREDGADTAVVTVGSNVELLELGHDEGDHEGEEGSHDEKGGHEEEDGHDEDASHDEDTDHTEDSGHTEDGSHEDEHGHDHADGKDPHFWLDPVRAKRAVETVREAFIEVDDANADAYARNAEAYESRLDDLHADFESALDGASKDTILVAGHDAFGYLADRYDFAVETLTGVSPDDAPTPKDVERAQHVVEEHDLDYVVADPLEPQTAANQLVAETDATEVLPLTSIPGRTEEWDEKGWGYVEIMEDINLPTLAKALDAE
jgi:zinc transport system substrate-binding protein